MSKHPLGFLSRHLRQTQVLSISTLLLAVALFGCTKAATPPPKYSVSIFTNLAHVGSNPTALIQGKDGRLYGTIQEGGARAEGAVFSMASDGADFRLLHSFAGTRSGGDGSWPQGLIQGSDGTLYGTTQTGGTPAGVEYGTGAGTVFKVNPDGSGYKVLHRFGATPADGLAPWAGLVEGNDGALYGTTLEGGSASGGTIFKIGKDGLGYKTLHHFQGGDTDGARPMAALLAASDGLLYGTTTSGGHSSQRNGTVFRIGPEGSGFAVLHNFPNGDDDGRMPRTALVEGSDGLLYGATLSGGKTDSGTVFKIGRDGANYKVLHSFSGALANKPDPSGLIEGTHNGKPVRFSNEGDGANPVALMFTREGWLCGAVENHGRNGGGAIFRIEPSGRKFATLVEFPNTQTNAENPARCLLQTGDGAIIGATQRSRETATAVFFRLAAARAKR